MSVLLVTACVGTACPGDADRDDMATTVASTAGSAGGDTTDPSPGTTTDPAEGSDDATATTAPIENACTDVSECTLVNDCCTCEAAHREADVAACAADCDRPLCDVWGIEELLCSHSCLIRLVECDAAMVTCADPAPPCDAGFVPSIDERCWSGHCVPAELCRPM